MMTERRARFFAYSWGKSGFWKCREFQEFQL
jgi:hypothetical protein